MKVYLGADHRGFALKEVLKKELARSYEVEDMGAITHEPTDDAVDFAKSVCQKVVGDQDARGVLICGSGAAMCIAANKIGGIRCSVCHSVEEVKASRHDDDLNVLALPADYVSQNEAVAIVKTFLTTEFAPEERFMRRIAKTMALETHA